MKRSIAMFLLVLSLLACKKPAPTATSGTHSVSLTWTASTSAVGYNIYRGTSSGGPYVKQNTALIPGTSWTDTAVTNGATYYYVARGVDANRIESGNSNQTSVVIPSAFSIPLWVILLWFVLLVLAILVVYLGRREWAKIFHVRGGDAR